MLSTLRVYDIIAAALRRCNAFAYGEPIDPDLARSAIFQLNVARAASAGTYLNYRYFDEVYTAEASTKCVTLGTGGNIAARPAKIDAAYAILGQVNQPLDLKTLEEFRALPYTEAYSLPFAAYLETGFPLAKLWLYPGLQIGYALRVVGLAYPADYNNIDETFADPPELVDYFTKRTAAQMAAELGKESGMLEAAADQAEAPIRQANFAARAKSLERHDGRVDFLSGRRR